MSVSLMLTNIIEAVKNKITNPPQPFQEEEETDKSKQPQRVRHRDHRLRTVSRVNLRGDGEMRI